MKLPLVVLVFCALAAADRNDGKLDGLEPKDILVDDKLFNKYYNCVMDKGECTPDGKFMKDDLSKGMEAHLANLTPAEQKNSPIIVKFMLENRKKEFEEFEKKYDPKKILRKKYA